MCKRAHNAVSATKAFKGKRPINQKHRSAQAVTEPLDLEKNSFIISLQKSVLLYIKLYLQ